MRAFEFYGEAFARWLREQNEGRRVRFEKVEPGDEQILEVAQSVANAAGGGETAEADVLERIRSALYSPASA